MRLIPSRASGRRIWSRPRTLATCSSCCERRRRDTGLVTRAGSSTNSSTTCNSATCTLRSNPDHDHPRLDRDCFYRFGYPQAKLTQDHRIQLRLRIRSEEHTSELQSPCNLVCRLLLEKKKNGPSTSLRTRGWAYARRANSPPQPS